MATKAKFQAIKGTRDLLPPETELWARVEAVAREVFGTYGFGEIRPPIFENTELFARAVGGETDIVNKEMYRLGDLFEDESTSNLAYLQLMIHSSSVSSAYPEQLSEFKGQVERFLEGYKAARLKGLVYRTDSTDRRFQFLESHLNDLSGLQNSSSASGFQYKFDETINYFKVEIRDLALSEPKALRPESTASVCRAYIEHNMNQWPAPVKLYYLGPMFWRERPQKGRYRQFYQIGAEVLGGTDAPGIDAEVIEMVMAFFTKLKLPGVVLEINSIGHSGVDAEGKPVCRRAYVEALRAALQRVKEQLGADSQRRIETNPLRVLDSKLESEQGIIAGLPKIGEYLCAECKTHYVEVKRQLDLRGVKYQENWRLVRGLDYYMRTTFEITARGLGSQNAVCGGGRYDGLVELLGGPPTKGIGFAIGEDRMILSLLEAKAELASRRVGRDVYIAWMGENAEATAVAAARRLREAGLRVELPAVAQKFGKALGQADRLGARFALILGDDEMASGMWTVKTLADGSQEKVPEAELVTFLQTRVG